MLVGPRGICTSYKMQSHQWYLYILRCSLKKISGKVYIPDFLCYLHPHMHTLFEAFCKIQENQEVLSCKRFYTFEQARASIIYLRFATYCLQSYSIT